MSVDPNSPKFKAAAADNMNTIAKSLDALVMLEGMVSRGLLPTGVARDCATLRDALAVRAEELRDPEGFVTESGVVIKFGEPNRVRRAS